MGNMNVKRRKDPRVSHVEHHSLHNEFNNNEIMMTNFAVTRKLVISSMMFPHKSVHKETWISPNCQTRSQINHVMIDARNIIDVQTYRGANCNNDHFTVKL
jgi:hypothetical protein